MKQLRGWWTDELSPHLEIFTPTGERLDVVVDSGFNGALMLPSATIESLGLSEAGPIQAELADGSLVWTRLFVGEIVWFGQTEHVWVQSTNSDEGLLGTKLFQGCMGELDPDAGVVILRKKPVRRR
jgi:clan AA aspartic protease